MSIENLSSNTIRTNYAALGSNSGYELDMAPLVQASSLSLATGQQTEKASTRNDYNSMRQAIVAFREVMNMLIGLLKKVGDDSAASSAMTSPTIGANTSVNGTDQSSLAPLANQITNPALSSDVFSNLNVAESTAGDPAQQPSSVYKQVEQLLMSLIQKVMSALYDGMGRILGANGGAEALSSNAVPGGAMGSVDSALVNPQLVCTPVATNSSSVNAAGTAATETKEDPTLSKIDRFFEIASHVVSGAGELAGTVVVSLPPLGRAFKGIGRVAKGVAKFFGLGKKTASKASKAAATLSDAAAKTANQELNKIK